MFEWAKKLFDDPRTLGAIVTSSVIGLLAGFAQGVVQRRHGGWGGFVSALATGVIVAVIVGLALQGLVPSEAMRFAIVGVCAIVAEDIWIGLKTLGQSLRADPLGFVFRVLDALRGQPMRRNTGAGPTRPAPLEGEDRP
jgi:hypothetical protein